MCGGMLYCSLGPDVGQLESYAHILNSTQVHQAAQVFGHKMDKGTTRSIV